MLIPTLSLVSALLKFYSTSNPTRFDAGFRDLQNISMDAKEMRVFSWYYLSRSLLPYDTLRMGHESGMIFLETDKDGNTRQEEKNEEKN